MFRCARLLFLRSPLRSEEHTSELQSLAYLVCRLLLEKKKLSSNHLFDDPDHDAILGPFLPTRKRPQSAGAPAFFNLSASFPRPARGLLGKSSRCALSS